MFRANALVLNSEISYWYIILKYVINFRIRVALKFVSFIHGSDEHKTKEREVN